MVFRTRVGSTRTDADGRFRLDGLKPDKAVTVWAKAPDFAPERRDEIHVFAGRDEDGARDRPRLPAAEPDHREVRGITGPTCR